MNNMASRFLEYCRTPVGTVGMMAYIILVTNLLLLLTVEGIFRLILNQNVTGIFWQLAYAVLPVMICIPALNALILRPMKQQQNLLQQQYNDLRIAAATFECHEGVIVTDADKKIIKVNQAFTNITGFSDEEAVGKTPALLSSGRQDKEFYRQMWETLQRDKCWSGEIYNRRKNGKIYPEWLTITPIHDGKDNVVNYVGIFSDISQRKASEMEIYNLAFYDALTHLPNRRLLNDRMIHAMAVSRRSEHYGAVMFIDLDNFKPLNDQYGHNAGDLLLIEAAKRLSSCIREMDTVARFGGDEFVVILGALDVNEAESCSLANMIAEKIRATLSAPYTLSIQKNEKEKHLSVEHHCTASIGVAMFFKHQGSHDEVMRWADIAMYQAKENGRNHIRFYDPVSGIVDRRASADIQVQAA